ncbi:sulfatase family protein [Halococcus salifodinae]|uniref:sulfatase family protein n=1 Tax=Halococcus salifodinae TaxID=36738 RepID=UPI0013760A96|nr:sulfatase [Halococcus salifodinae]
MPTIYIDIDSLRADHVGAYGYDAPTTPNIDEFAEESVLFERNYASNSPCMPARAALLTGRYGIHNGVETHGPPSQTHNSPAFWIDWGGTWGNQIDERPWWTLPELFYNQRTQTCAISSFPRHPAPWFNHVWHRVYQPQEPEGPEESFQTVRGESVIDLALEYISKHLNDEFFLYIQLWDPHGPYKRSEEEISEFRGQPLPPYPTKEEIEAHQEWDAWRSAPDMSISDRDDLAEMLAHYDAEIRYADTHVGRLFDYLKENDIYDDSLITVSADHGEEFGEHGLYREHWSTHEGTQHIPLILKPPTSTPAELGRRKQLVTNVDIAPTLADYAGYEAPAQWQGQSLRPVIENNEASWRDHIVFDHGLYTAQRTIRTDRWKLIRTYHSGLWPSVVPDSQLYDMHDDPWERKNVVESNSDIVKDLKMQMDNWCEKHASEGKDPLQEVVEEGPAGYLAFGDGYDGV